MTKSFTFDSSFGTNAIFWLCGLPEDERGPTRRIVEDLQVQGRLPIPVRQVDLNSPDDLTIAIQCLCSMAAREGGIRPIVHLDMHGSPSDGIKAGNGFLDWESLGNALRDLNSTTGNKLLVVGGACHSLSTIRSLDIHSASPFYALIAPEGEVLTGVLEEKVVPFYETLFKTGSLDQAVAQLGQPFRYVHCKKVLFIILARYIKNGLKGRTLEERRERLLTEVFLGHEDKTPDAIRRARAAIKDGLKPTQDLVNRYAGPFLCNRPCGFSIEDLLNMVS